MSKNTISAAKVASASKAALSAYDALKSGEAKVKGAFTKGLFLSGTKLPPLTYASYEASGVKTPLGEGLTSRGVATAGVQLSKWKPLIVLGSHRPAGLAFGKWAHDPKEGEDLDTFGSRARAALASMTLADGTPVVPADKPGAKVGSKSKRKGKTKAGSRADNAAKAKAAAANAPKGLTEVKGPTAAEITATRETSALTLMGSPKAAADLLKVLNDKEGRADLMKAIASIASSIDEAKAKFEAEVKSAQKSNLAAPSLAQAKAAAKAKGFKANGAATH